MDQNELFHNNLLQDHTSLQQDFFLKSTIIVLYF
jgi:hypothetical protein